MASSDTRRKLTAILSADVVGYSRLMGTDEEATIETLTAYRKVFVSKIKNHRGRVVDAKGDAILAEFASVVDSVNSAVEIQRELARKNAELSGDTRMDFRIGINLGDVVVKDDAIYGDGVNVAARLEALAESGGICISRPVHDQVKAKLDLEYEYLGEQQVKNIAEPVRAYKVRMNHKIAKPLAKEAKSDSDEDAELSLPEQPSIAVLAFENMSGDPEQEYFSDGISEDIITDLAKISGLFVIARNASFSYKGKAGKPQDVAQELGVRFVLEGSVRKAGNRVRITAQLIDAQTGRHQWAERYDRELDDIFSVQDEITEEIVTALDVHLAHGERARILRNSFKSPKARDSYYRAMEYYWSHIMGDMEPARRLLDEVILLEPESPVGFVAKARTYIADARRAQGEGRQPNFEPATKLVHQALALDEFHAEGLAVLAYFHVYNREYERAIAEAERAVALSPNDPEILYLLAAVILYAGDPQEAIVLLNRAMRLSPVYPIMILGALGAAYRMTGQYEQAITVASRGIHRDPEYVIGHFIRITALSEMGHHEEAKSAARKLGKINPRFSPMAWAKSLPYKDPADMKRIVGLLRKAGLPE